MKKIGILVIVFCLFFSMTNVVAMQKQANIEAVNNDITTPLKFDDMIPSILEQLDVTMMLEYIQDIVLISLSHPVDSRVTGLEGCEETAEYIEEQFTDMGLSVRQHHWEAVGKFGIWKYLTFISWNVEATLPGLNGNNEEIYIVSAHYDSVPSTPGADDNAAGVAAVLSAAKILSQYEFNQTIRFVCFSGEEQGLLGSEEYAKEAYNNNENLISTINLDMIGYSETEEDKTKIRFYEDQSSDWIGDLAVDVNQAYYDYIGFDEVVRSYDPSGHSSDYTSFWQFAYDAVFNHEYKWNPYKDTPQDTIANMDVVYATKVARFMLATISSLAMSPIIENTPPEEPDAPQGEKNPKINVYYTYTTSTTDSDGDQVYYLFDWGDGSNSGWVGPYNSGETGQASHKWTEKGDYKVKVKAKDEHRILSQWSAQTSLSMTRSNLRNFIFNNPFILRILQRLIDLF